MSNAPQHQRNTLPVGSDDTGETDTSKTTGKPESQPTPGNTEHQQMTTPEDSISIIAAPANLYRRINAEEKRDLGESYKPDAYLVTDESESIAGIKQLEYDLYGSTDLLYPARSEQTGAQHYRIGNIDIVTASSVSDLRDIKEFEEHNVLRTDTETVIISNLLSIDVSLGSLDAEMNNLKKYRNALAPNELKGTYTHLSGAIAGGYAREWDGLLIRGIGYGSDRKGAAFTHLTAHADGIITTDTIRPNKLGLQAIDNVGPRTAERLQSHGHNTIESISNAKQSALATLPGIGEKKASTIINSATALSEGTIIPTSDNPVPASDPVFIDIETDGLNPTSVWLIGVKDGYDGNYMSFIDTSADPDGSAVESFIAWYSANASHRTLMAWNGWNFDFPVLREHIQKYAPQYLDDWERASKRDPLRWARDLGNAILPGRTNKLETVADALGWNDHDTGLDGQAVARQYRAWVNNPSDETELEWDRHRQYCQDDVEALELIVKHMDEATRVDGEVGNHDRPTDENTSQGTLGDY